MFSSQLLTIAVLTPRARSVRRNGSTSWYRRALASSSSRLLSATETTRPGSGSMLQARMIRA